MDQSTGELRILLLEDVPTDAELEEQALQDAGMEFVSLRVDTEAAFVRALTEFAPHIVLADYRLPAYNGRDALVYVRRTYPQIPVIMVTGVLGDEAAVELLKLGARDYVLKSALARLAPAIRRALSEERGIRNRKLAEGKYKALFSEAMDGIVLIDCGTWKIADCNPEFERQTGRKLEQLRELVVWEVVPAGQHELARQALLEIQRSGSGRGSDFTIQQPGGEIVPIEFTAKFVSIQQQSFIQSITRDITERKLAEQLIRDEKAFSDKLIDSLPDIFYLIDRQGRLLRWNRKGEVLLGLSPEELSGANILAFVHAQDQPLAAQKIQQAFETGSAGLEARLLMKGDARDYVLTATRIEVQREVNVIGFGIDITARKQAEAALHRLNRALKTLSAGNLALVRARSEDELLRAVTNVIADTGGYLLAVVDYAEDDPEKNLVPRAWSGMAGDGYWAERLSWADTELGQLPVSRAIRSGTTQLCHDIASDPAFQPWRNAVLARGYVSNIALPLSSDGKIFGGLSIYSSDANAFDDDEIRLLEELASDLAYGIVTLRARVEHEQHAKILRQSLEQSIQIIAATVEARDPYTAGHQRRVAILATAIAREMELPAEQIEGIHFAATIHDLGKIHIPAEILAKPGKLSHIEFMLINEHPKAGYDILKDVNFPWPIADIILQHHEKLDGSGYPQGLKEGQILLEARILAVADVVEAISTHRPYRPGLGIEAALEEIERNRGVLYDPAAVDTCIKLFREQDYQLPD